MKIDHFQNMHLDRCMLSLIKKKKRKKMERNEIEIYISMYRLYKYKIIDSYRSSIV